MAVFITRSIDWTVVACKGDKVSLVPPLATASERHEDERR
jgi:hypothetical protein